MNGVINIFKNKGMTSFDVVRKIKKITGTGKVGHTGTLDPEATGVLPVCIGKATKIIDYIMNTEKGYEVEFKLGVKTTTYDLEGDIIEEKDINHLNDDEILKAIYSFVGEYSQVPPMYSALKQNGVRLYELARRGIEVHREGRLITIYNIENVVIKGAYIRMKVTCSKGTYIRSLCFDIGEALGVGACMTDLKRFKTSVFLEEDSINIDDLTEDNISNYIISMEEALKTYEKITVGNKYGKLLINGVRVFDNRISKDKIEIDKLYRVYNEDEIFIGLGRKNNQGFKMEKLLNS
ncbi:tRNA pseudouridine(55) synthase TruB [Clostridium septicum]|uniref:tRNA pseudouridine synthase B n=1 Tax=Clostridium septicum TaxID=1504 RepID=A0A9N7JIQ0_CLOSE|nr:tRNA pseudouridine(55) synthase TruB [Clostridium septicum]AYE33064.1 tRNA pseudouridine(55) synthase TruB [Clostridium septicum]MDU1314524.1 tRNA pseudouridine(55) synthase TruB [Clostridium septicum]QAS61233.1 tRNA pseudouridine(55) synthase TruB [Clostridium septicum]UEC19414.1 tRNA pseudouridine(55) synthase TruB [Clostridium septicum]USR99633.1 tRNA pseudouridine(55) synthase TruB [Clostridium septicum]